MAAPTLLIVDDEPSILETLREILEWEGYAVVTARNGQEGLAELERTAPALVLVDYMMPVMDGVQMLQALRASPTLEHLPAVMMSAVHVHARVPGVAKLYDAFLTKPFELDALLGTVERLLGKR
jgi:CheY-like chemotaxis protein